MDVEIKEIEFVVLNSTIARAAAHLISLEIMVVRLSLSFVKLR